MKHLFAGLLVFGFSTILSNSLIAQQKKMVLHQVKSSDNRSFYYDTTYVYFKLMKSFDASLGEMVEDTIWLDGNYEVIKKKKKSESAEQEENLRNKIELKKQDDLLKSKSDEIVKINKNCEDLKNEILEIKSVKPTQLIPYSTIGKQKWTSNNLSEIEIKSITKDIIMANSDEEWEAAFSQSKPAYCYHRDDNNRSNGVLLNLFALKQLYKKLEASQSEWRLPTQSDFDNLLNTLKSIKGSTVVSLLASSSTTIPSWKKPGFDMFDMHLLPLSYRRNNETKWYGTTETTIFCLNPDDVNLTTTMKMIEINDSEEDKNSLIIKSKDITSEDNNIGVYVRLIKK